MGDDKHFAEVKEVIKAHEKAPASTGCIWRHTQGAKGTCNYGWNSYNVCQGRAKFRRASGGWQVPEGTEYLADVLARYTALGEEKGAKKGWTATAVSKWAAKYTEAYGDAMSRLQQNPLGWDIGVTAPPRFATKQYLGRVGSKTSAGKASLGESLAANILPSKSGGLGAWYPYRHQHHHLIAVGEIQNFLVAGADTRKRVAVLVQSTWNVNAGRNVLVLPTDVTIAGIMKVPAHCPWGTASHPAWSKRVESALKTISKSLKEAAATEKSHAEYDRRAAKVKEDLDALSDKLYKICLTLSGPL